MMTTILSQDDAMFSGIIGQEYDMLQLICPAATEMSRLVGEACALINNANCLDVVELGGGTGITTLALLTAKDHARILSVDNEPTMQAQAKQRLQQWAEQGRLDFSNDDALSALQKLPSNSVDVVASAYTLHNFPNDYREQVINEIFRVLRAGGQFINGDRYALNDVEQHTRNTQAEISHYFQVLVPMNRFDLLEKWLVHLFSDESENHIMREAVAIQQLHNAGFLAVQINYRQMTNALVTAIKPPVETLARGV